LYGIDYIPLTPWKEKDLDPNKNGFDESCVNVVGAGLFHRSDAGAE